MRAKICFIRFTTRMTLLQSDIVVQVRNSTAILRVCAVVMDTLLFMISCNDCHNRLRIKGSSEKNGQPMGQYKINTNPNAKYVLLYYVINAGPFFSFDPN